MKRRCGLFGVLTFVLGRGAARRGHMVTDSTPQPFRWNFPLLERGLSESSYIRKAEIGEFPLSASAPFFIVEAYVAPNSTRMFFLTVLQSLRGKLLSKHY